MNMLTKITPEIATMLGSPDLATMKFEPMCSTDEIGLYMGKVRQSHTSFAAAIMLASMSRDTLVKYVRGSLEKDQDSAIGVEASLHEHIESLRCHAQIAKTAHTRYLLAMTEAAGLSFAEMFPVSPWDAALAKFRALQAAETASDFGETEETEEAFHQLVSAKTDAADNLIETEAPDLAALADKLDVIKDSYATGNIGLDVIEALCSDVRRLAVEGGA